MAHAGFGGTAIADIDCITLDEGALWPTLNTRTLFVREWYGGCYDGVMGSLLGFVLPSGKYARKFIVCGTPGIGKSAFGLYALYRALREGHTVVYDVAKLDFGFVLSPHGVSAFEHAHVALQSAIRQRDTLYISDSITPPVVNAFTLFITSPRRDRYHEFRKEGDCIMLYAPSLLGQRLSAAASCATPSRTWTPSALATRSGAAFRATCCGRRWPLTRRC